MEVGDSKRSAIRAFDRSDLFERDALQHRRKPVRHRSAASLKGQVDALRRLLSGFCNEGESTGCFVKGQQIFCDEAKLF